MRSVFAALGHHAASAVDLAGSSGGVAFVAVEGVRDPVFTSLVIAPDRAAVEPIADVGLYEVTVRRMRHQRRTWPSGEVSPGVTAAYPMVRHPGLTHEQADAHWRDVHAPLALRHHPGMWHYHQVSIDRVLDGRPFDGIALCAFASEQDLAERFFGGPEDQAVISADVATFSDLTASPRRVRMREWRFIPD